MAGRARGVEKFGRAAIDDPSNIVWVPRLKHELISAFYNSADNFDQGRRLRRLIVNELDYDSQYAAGLKALQAKISGIAGGISTFGAVVGAINQVLSLAPGL